MNISILNINKEFCSIVNINKNYIRNKFEFYHEIVEHNQRILDRVLRQRSLKSWEENRLFNPSDNGALNN